ncbi:MAG TPA: alpha/beta hydrolase [Gemmatimonadaceae bacterium]|nr:alpha/beta hydrolase [Gemmatimonadaceae bacterium]
MTKNLNANGNGAGSDVNRFVTIGGQTTHYLDYPGPQPSVVLLHGLSANANEFCGLVNAGLGASHRVIAPDLRGRGQSGKPASGYSMGQHAADVIALLDHLGLDRVVMGGHSFGALLAIYLAAHFPERVSRIIVIDAAIVFHPDVVELLKPSLARLARVLPSADAYMEEMRAAPHVVGFWDDAIEGYFRAELHSNPDGTVQSITSANAVEQALLGVQVEPWADLVARVRHPAILLNASEGFGPPGSPPLVPPEHAKMTAGAFIDCLYVPVPGNHLTMVFGANAGVVTREIEHFLVNGAGAANE